MGSYGPVGPKNLNITTFQWICLKMRSRTPSCSHFEVENDRPSDFREGFPRFPWIFRQRSPQASAGPLASLKSPSIKGALYRRALRTSGHYLATRRFRTSIYFPFLWKKYLYNLYHSYKLTIYIYIYACQSICIHLTRWFSTHFWVCKSFTTPKMSAILPSVSVWRCVHPPCAAPLTPKRTCWGRSGKQIVASGWVWQMGGCHKNIQKWNC